MNRMIFRSFRKRNSSQKNTNTVYSEYSYSGIVPKERALLNHISRSNEKPSYNNPKWVNLFIFLVNASTLSSFVADYHNNISSLSCSAHVIISIQCLSPYCWLIFSFSNEILVLFFTSQNSGCQTAVSFSSKK